MSTNDKSEESSLRPKSIVGLNFRQIVESLEDNSNLTEGGSLYFLEENEPSYVEKETISLQNRIKKFFNVLIIKLPILGFINDLVLYLSTRTRVTFVLTGVLSEVISSQFEMVKKYMIRKMFWGRSNLFRFSLQLLGAFVFIVVVVAGGYRSGIVDAGFEFVGDSVNPSYQLDVLVQNSSTRTIVANPEFGSVQPEKYIVKGGDTLSSIAEDHGRKVETILWANKLTLNSLINPGMELDIPPGDGVIIEVEEGMTLDSLADEYDTSSQIIAQWNFIDPPFDLEPGKILFLPDATLPVKQQPSTIATAPTYTGVVVAPPPAVNTGNPTFADPDVGRFLNWPVAEGGSLSQCYTGFHNGVDISGTLGSPLVAASSGTVTFAGCQSGNCPPPGQAVGGWGLAWTVIVDHGNGYSSVYAHMNNITVTSGQFVEVGQTLGELGMSGLATGPHVHFMLIRSGSTWSHINPAAYMTNSLCGY